jgi:predicted porin
MKKSLLALAALTAFAGAASAQSSVTLFGIVDVNIRTTDNDNGAVSSLGTDGNSSSRLGFRGVEDLGGGLKAGFWLEAALSPDTGLAGSASQAVNQIFNRRATVSLMGGWGEVRLGRDYTATFWNHTVFDPFGTNGVGSQLNMMTQQGIGNPNGASSGTLVRANNAMSYFLPTMGGLYGQLQLALGEGGPPGNDYYGGRIGYAAGPFNVAFAYGVTTEGIPAGTTGGPQDLEAWNIGGSWNFGFMNLMGQYSEYDVSIRSTKNFTIGATFPLGNGVLKGSYSATEVDGGSTLPSGDATMFAFGYVYDLSKRTALYAHYAIIDNDPGVRFVVPGGKSRVPDSGFGSQGMEFGVRHSF